MKLFDRLFKPVVRLSTVYTVAKAAGVLSFSELLEKALANGQVNEQQAAALRAKALDDQDAANEELNRTIQAAKVKHANALAQVSAIQVQADQKALEAKETLDAVAEFKKAMGAKS